MTTPNMPRHPKLSPPPPLPRYELRDLYECPSCHEQAIERFEVGPQISCAVLSLNPQAAKPSDRIKFGKPKTTSHGEYRFHCANCGDVIRNRSLFPVSSAAELLAYLQDADCRYRPRKKPISPPSPEQSSPEQHP